MHYLCVHCLSTSFQNVHVGELYIQWCPHLCSGNHYCLTLIRCCVSFWVLCSVSKLMQKCQWYLIIITWRWRGSWSNVERMLDSWQLSRRQMSLWQKHVRDVSSSFSLECMLKSVASIGFVAELWMAMKERGVMSTEGRCFNISELFAHWNRCKKIQRKFHPTWKNRSTNPDIAMLDKQHEKGARAL